MKKLFQMLLLVFFLCVIYSYVIVIENLPEELVILEGETISMQKLFGLNVVKKDLETIETSSSESIKLNSETKKANLEINLFDKLPLKNVEVSILPKTKVIPVGNIAGVKLYTSGILVVGMSEIEGEDNKKYKPYENTGIQEGDTITKINNNYITSTDNLIETVNLSKGKDIKIEYIHEMEAKECSMTPVKTNLNDYKLGLWVRDSAAGVGTVTFYEPQTKTFGALGHGITDIDTNELINISSRRICNNKNIRNSKRRKRKSTVKSKVQ